MCVKFIVAPPYPLLPTLLCTTPSNNLCYEKDPFSRRRRKTFRQERNSSLATSLSFHRREERRGKKASWRKKMSVCSPSIDTRARIFPPESAGNELKISCQSTYRSNTWRRKKNHTWDGINKNWEKNLERRRIISRSLLAWIYKTPNSRFINPEISRKYYPPWSSHVYMGKSVHLTVLISLLCEVLRTALNSWRGVLTHPSSTFPPFFYRKGLFFLFVGNSCLSSDVRCNFAPHPASSLPLPFLSRGKCGVGSQEIPPYVSGQPKSFYLVLCVWESGIARFFLSGRFWIFRSTPPPLHRPNCQCRLQSHPMTGDWGLRARRPVRHFLELGPSFVLLCIPCKTVCFF